MWGRGSNGGSCESWELVEPHPIGIADQGRTQANRPQCPEDPSLGLLEQPPPESGYSVLEV